MPTSVVVAGEVWDVVVSRSVDDRLLTPVWLTRSKTGVPDKLLCQISHSKRFGWNVVVNGPVKGVRLVEGFKARWHAIRYALNIREDLYGGDC